MSVSFSQCSVVCAQSAKHCVDCQALLGGPCTSGWVLVIDARLRRPRWNRCSNPGSLPVPGYGTDECAHLRPARQARVDGIPVGEFGQERTDERIAGADRVDWFDRDDGVGGNGSVRERQGAQGTEFDDDDARPECGRPVGRVELRHAMGRRRARCLKRCLAWRQGRGSRSAASSGPAKRMSAALASSRRTGAAASGDQSVAR